MFLARAWQKHWYLLSMLREELFSCHRHKNTVNYCVFALGSTKKTATIRQKVPNMDLQNASCDFRVFFPTPNPEKHENTTRVKDFGGSRGAPG